MQESVGMLIAAARRCIKQAVLARVAERRLTAQQFWLLVALGEHPGISQSALAERIHADAPTISRTLAALAERRLVRTDLDRADRRRTRVFLTGTGERLSAELAPVARHIREVVVEGMTQSQIASLREGLLRVIANVDRLGARTGARERT
jgi:DNA-binding MarR family transcriptional regulator